MIKSKKALSGAGTTDRAMETAALTGAAASEDQYTMTGKRAQGHVEALLLRGEGNAIPTAQLMQLAGFRYQRELRMAIEQERRNGALILSTVRGHGGYYLPSTDPAVARAEIADFVRTVRSRALNSLVILQSANAALRVLPGQEVLPDA